MSGQWFEAAGDKNVRYVMARKNSNGWIFLSMLGRKWCETAASLLNSSAPDENLCQGSAVLRQFLFDPEAFKMKECFKPGISKCNE